MKRIKGFTLIELLIVVAIIGIIAAIAIPNLLDAIERSRQKRSVGELKTLAGAMQSFSTDFGGYPPAANNGDPSVKWPLLKDAAGSPVVVPDLIQAVPAGDGWNIAYNTLYAPDGTIANPTLGTVTAGHFAIWSLGADRKGAVTPDGGGIGATIAGTWCADPPVTGGTLQSHCYNADIVWGDSSFLQAPEGKQKRC